MSAKRSRLWPVVVLGCFLVLALQSCSQLSTVGNGGAPGGGGGGPAPPPPPPPVVLPDLFAISTSSNGQFGVAVGASGSIVQGTQGFSSTGKNFPNWATVGSGVTGNTLRGASFDESGATIANVVAVGDTGQILENTSSGGDAPSPWIVANNSASFDFQDLGCAGTLKGNLASISLFGVSLYNAFTSQPVVAVGGPLTDPCGKTKGVVLVSTSSITLPYNGWRLVDTAGFAPFFPGVTFRGVSFAQHSVGGSGRVVVVGDQARIRVGTTADLTNTLNWTTHTSDIDGNASAQFNGVALGSDSRNAIAVGKDSTGGIIYVNADIQFSTVWTRVNLATFGITPPAEFTAVHFIKNQQAGLTAVVVGKGPGKILLISSCCANGTLTVSDVTPGIAVIPNFGTLNGVWGPSGGPANGLVVAAGAGGLIIESTTGGTPAAKWQQDRP